MSAELIWDVCVNHSGGPLVRFVRLARLRVGDVTFNLQITDQYESRPSADQRPGTHHSRAVEFLGYQMDNRDHAFDHVPYEDDGFAWAARFFFDEFAADTTQVTVLVRGDDVAVRREDLRPIETATMVGPIWCPVANMKAERPYGPGGKETKRGSRHFAPGAKVYCDYYQWGDGYDQIQVVGHHRGSHRYVTMVVSSSWLTNWRLELAYSPHVIRELWPEWDGTARGKERALEIVNMMQERDAAKS